MMGTNNVTINDPMQVCDLLFGDFCVDPWSIKWIFLMILSNLLIVVVCKVGFDCKLLHLGHHMKSEVTNVLKPILAFAFSFQTCNAHNILVLMLDPWFKNL
jgi:hypothetical protein